jgi:triacylglycerol lipase
MYYPENFDHGKAIELAGLVKQAYGRIEAFQKNETWALQGKHALINELYDLGPEKPPAKPGAGAKPGASLFEKEQRKFEKTKSSLVKGLPIGFVAEDRAAVYLVFRGTVTVNEWIYDLNLRLAACPYLAAGKVHEGFLQTYQFFRPGILDTLSRLDPRKRLFIAGHSLGAALATLALPDLASATGFKLPIVYTFASPRVGDKAFVKAYNGLFQGRSFRIANSSDIVVSLPLPVPFLGFIGGFFTHVETPVVFTAQEEDLEKNHIIETYLAALKAEKGTGGFLSRLLRWSRVKKTINPH